MNERFESSSSNRELSAKEAAKKFHIPIEEAYDYLKPIEDTVSNKQVDVVDDIVEPDINTDPRQKRFSEDDVAAFNEAPGHDIDPNTWVEGYLTEEEMKDRQVNNKPEENKIALTEDEIKRRKVEISMLEDDFEIAKVYDIKLDWQTFLKKRNISEEDLIF